MIGTIVAEFPTREGFNRNNMSLVFRHNWETFEAIFRLEGLTWIAYVYQLYPINQWMGSIDSINISDPWVEQK